MRFVNWLNQNQGVVMATLTFVYVIATIVIAGLSVKSNRLAQQSIETIVELEKNRLRPYVIFNLSSSIRKKITFASIKNFGLTAAYNIKVSIDPALTHHYDGQSPLTHRDILLLPPHERITDLIDSSPAFHQQYPDPVFKGVVQYEDSNGKQYKEPFRIDLTFLKKRVYVRDASIADELKELNKTLVLINRNLQPKESDFDELETSLKSLDASSSG
jgi:hypothetical protein